MPSQWLEGGGDTCFVERGQIFTVNSDFVAKAKAPKVINSDRNISICATFFGQYVISLGSDHSFNVFTMDASKLIKSLCIGIICPLCGAVSRDTGHYRLHKRRHDADPLNCDRCKQLVEKMDINIHINSCPYMCPYEDCDKTNVKKDKHEAHIRMHKRSLSN